MILYKDLNCYKDDTEVEIQGGGTKTVAELRVGDKIKSMRSLEDTRCTFAKVIEAINIEGSFSAHELVFGNGSSLTVTSPHYMLVYKGKTAKVVRAVDVQLGDYMRMRNGSLSSVVRVRVTELSHKVSINTESGLMYVNGVLATGMCDQGPEDVDSAEAFLSDYRETHRLYNVTIITKA